MSEIYMNEKTGLCLDFSMMTALDLVEEDKAIRVQNFNGKPATYHTEDSKDIFNKAMQTGLFIQNIVGLESLNMALCLQMIPTDKSGDYGQIFDFIFATGILVGEIDDVGRFMKECKIVKQAHGAKFA